MPAKKTISKKKPATKKKATRSFERATAPNFMSFQLTQQTVYWSILCVLVLALGIWVTFLSVQVQNIYDQIEITNATEVNARQ